MRYNMHGAEVDNKGSLVVHTLVSYNSLRPTSASGTFLVDGGIQFAMRGEHVANIRQNKY